MPEPEIKIPELGEKIPKEFTLWLRDTYPQEQWRYWEKTYAEEDWWDDPVYIYWNLWLNPENQWKTANIGRQLAGLVGTKQLQQTLQALVFSGDLTNYEGDALFSVYEKQVEENRQNYLVNLPIPQEVKDYLGQWTSKSDLADRLNRITGLDDATKADIYSNLTEVASASEEALRGAMGRQQAAFAKSQQEAEKKLKAQQAAQEKWAKESEVEQAAQLERANEVKEALDYTRRNPLVTGKDLSATFAPGQGAIYGTMDDFLNNSATIDMMNAYIQGSSDDFVNKLAELNRSVTQRGVGEEQANLNLLASLDRGREQKEPFLRPLIPSARGVAESYLAGTQLGEGTRLRSFIESEIPAIYEDVKQRREDWWARMNPEPQEVETYEDVRDRLQAGAEKWQGIAGVASTSPYTAGTYWGEGGLAGIAQQAYEHAQKSISALKPGDYPLRERPRAIIPEEDPFAKALREIDFRAKYYRRPGAGIVSRLTPSVRVR